MLRKDEGEKLNKRELLSAIRWTQDAKVVEYLNAGGNPNIKLQGCSILIWAVRAGVNVDTVRLILQKGAKVDEHDNPEHITALIEGLYRGHFDLVKVLLEWGADVNATDANGNTPFIISAAMAWDFEIPSFLLRHGADPNIQNHLGHSAVDVARMNSHLNFESNLKAFLNKN